MEPGSTVGQPRPPDAVPGPEPCPRSNIDRVQVRVARSKPATVLDGYDRIVDHPSREGDRTGHHRRNRGSFLNREVGSPVAGEPRTRGKGRRNRSGHGCCRTDLGAPGEQHEDEGGHHGSTVRGAAAVF